MSQTLSGAVAALRESGAAVAEAGARIDGRDPGMRAFGGDAPGQLGELGRAMHACCRHGLDARAREASDQADRLVETADLLARVAAGYREIDHSARQRHPEVG